MTDFEKAIEFVLSHEGGYVNNPADPGGETKFGISKKAYPSVDIVNLTVDQAKQIYFRDYWERASCQTLAWPLNLIVFDTAVNMGINIAVYIPQGDWRDYLLLRIKKYLDRIKANPKLGIFLRGWLNRVLDLYSIACQ